MGAALRTFKEKTGQETGGKPSVRLSLTTGELEFHSPLWEKTRKQNISCKRVSNQDKVSAITNIQWLCHLKFYIVNVIEIPRNQGIQKAS